MGYLLACLLCGRQCAGSAGGLIPIWGDHYRPPCQDQQQGCHPRPRSRESLRAVETHPPSSPRRLLLCQPLSPQLGHPCRLSPASPRPPPPPPTPSLLSAPSPAESLWPQPRLVGKVDSRVGRDPSPALSPPGPPAPEPSAPATLASAAASTSPLPTSPRCPKSLPHTPACPAPPLSARSLPLPVFTCCPGLRSFGICLRPEADPQGWGGSPGLELPTQGSPSVAPATAPDGTSVNMSPIRAYWTDWLMSIRTGVSSVLGTSSEGGGRKETHPTCVHSQHGLHLPESGRQLFLPGPGIAEPGPGALEGGPRCGAGSLSPEEPPPPGYRCSPFQSSLLTREDEGSHAHGQMETSGHEGPRLRGWHRCPSLGAASWGHSQGNYSHFTGETMEAQKS